MITKLKFPVSITNNKKLKLIDSLVYCYYLKHVDWAKRCTFISVQTIANKLDVVRQVVVNSTKRLEDAGFIRTTSGNIGRTTVKYVPRITEDFIEIDIDIIDSNLLTNNEKALFINLLPYLKNKSTTDTYSEISEKVNSSKRTINRIFLSLVDKGVVTIERGITEFGVNRIKKTFLW